MVAKGFSGLPSSPHPMELQILTKPPSETRAHPLNALPSRKGASICCREGFLDHHGLLAPQTRPQSPLGIWGWEGHVPVPPRLASFSVDPFSAEMALSSDPAHPGMEMWSVFEPWPLGRAGPQRFWRRGQGHLPWPLQWLSPAAFSLHVETLWLKPLTTASLVAFHHLHP